VSIRLNFKDKAAELAKLLEDHDYLHAKMEAQPEVSDEIFNQLIHDNTHHISQLVGLVGVRGLVHVALETLDCIGHDGLATNSEGEFVDQDEGEAYLLLFNEIKEINRLLGLLAIFRGKLPEDHRSATQALVERFGLDEFPITP
jgi:hypothetical protein